MKKGRGRGVSLLGRLVCANFKVLNVFALRFFWVVQFLH